MPRSRLSSKLPVLSNYEVLEKIAESDLALLYKAIHKATGAVVAIKVPSAAAADQPALLKRFEVEFQAGSKLRHPNLVQTVDFGRDGATPYLVMEFVEGETLWDAIKRQGRLAEAEAVRVIVEVAQGLHEAHKHGLVHRDIKPDNILLSTDGPAKLSDLGLVKDLEAEVGVTRSRTGLGTPNFIAPEQFGDAKHADFRCDIYGLGATLYMAATGELPFRGHSIAAILKKKFDNELTPPRQLVPALGERTERAILRALRIDPQRRQASCREFVSELTGKGRGASDSGTTRSRRAGPSRGDPARATQGERRATVRYPCDVDTSCNVNTSILSDGPEALGSWQATVLDLSVTGAGLLSERRFEPGTLLLVDLRSPDGSFTRTSEARVLRVQRQGRGRWFLGCAFTEPLSEDERRRLL